MRSRRPRCRSARSRRRTAGPRRRRRLSMLSETQKRQYEEDGYLVLEDMLAASELEDLRQASQELQEERVRAGGAEGLAVIQDIVFKGEAFMKTAFHPGMLAAVADLI